jgi:N utilization substance protein A
MASQLYQTIDQLSREKGIDAQVIVSAVEDAMLVATRKFYKSGEDLKAEFNKDTGQVEVYAIKKIVEEVVNPVKEASLEEARAIDPAAQLEGELKIRKATDVLGRIAAQTAKQVIYQKVREAERDTVYNEYSGRVGELINCMVKRLEGPDLIVDIGKAEARLPRREQSRLESYAMGDRLRAIIIKVEKSVKGPQVIISRATPDLVLRLFEQEVPEIYDGTVVIKACAREAGERTKIAVLSRDRDVDSVGACVGMKGMRVESIRRELRGEKIDIVQYSEDPLVFAHNSLSPAKISRVTIVDPAQKHLEVIVDDTQLSLAIGKKGQNVRLASKLMGWRIDIKSEEEKRQEVEWQMGQLVGSGTPLSQLSALSDKLREKLTERDIATIEKLGAMTPEQLEEIPGIGPKMVEKIRAAVQNYWEGTEEGAGTAEGGEAAEPEAVEGEAAEAGTVAVQAGAAESAQIDQIEDSSEAGAGPEPGSGSAAGEPAVPLSEATEPGLTAEPAEEAKADKLDSTVGEEEAARDAAAALKAGAPAEPEEPLQPSTGPQAPSERQDEGEGGNMSS